MRYILPHVHSGKGERTNPGKPASLCNSGSDHGWAGSILSALLAVRSMIAALKFLHIAAIAIWAGGLLSLPALYVQRAHVRDARALYQLQMIVRFSYVAVISPAAFLAVGSGIALIFGQQTFSGWFSVKLFFVALLVMLHVLTGLVIIRLFREGKVYPVWRFLLATAVTGAVVVIILFVVLAKPALTVELNRDILEPGGLQRLIRTLSPWPLP